jgi:hypothetical protein
MNWLLLVYKVPSEPSARRVYVWRKLKKLGAILLHDAVWSLPANARTRENLQWLASEIDELEGEVLLWEAKLTDDGQEESLIQQFSEQVDTEYRSILTELNKSDADLETLARRYQRLKQQDYFQSTTGEKVRAALIKAREGREA